MFDGFGLFGTGIGTGFFGKMEDLALKTGCTVSNTRRAWENAKFADRMSFETKKDTVEKSTEEEEKEAGGEESPETEEIL